MRRKYTSIIGVALGALSFCNTWAPCANAQSTVQFKSSDIKLTEAFQWAKRMALHYKGQTTDPVGAWYESALPPRFAFCMRDVSHQSIGAEILGMSLENKNMLGLFASHLSESKDWCSYWEMNKWGQPAPEDYRNDREFWYNLPANFDVMFAAWRLFQWTGNRYYIENAAFVNFQQKSADQYIKKWVLQADSLLSRPAHPNAPVPYHEDDSFHRCRGLPSYSEGVANLKVGADLVAALYRGLTTYAEILRYKGLTKESEHYLQLAQKYEQHLEHHWWNSDRFQYYTYYSNDGKFGNDEGETFLLWFAALNDLQRRESTIEHVLTQKRNVENMSYYPWLFYKYGHWADAHKYILYLADPATKRREYPEVSFGIIEGVVQGLMGVTADARTQTISTIYRPTGGVGNSCIKNLPVLGSTVSLTHGSPVFSVLLNSGKKKLIWRAMFNGNMGFATVNNVTKKLNKSADEQGHVISYLDVAVAPAQQVTVAAKP